jgi:putative chitinase
MIKLTQFKKVFPNAKYSKEWIRAMDSLFPKYNINTPKRIAAFLSQCGHESGGWRVFKENLNYSESGLNKVFSKYFKRAGRDASKYARNPEEIANIVYAGRMGNNKSNDGWKYKGRGPIQLTGKNNYSEFSSWINNPEIIENPDLVHDDKNIGLLSAIWFWESNKLNEIADTGDVEKLTRRINGGTHGLEDRIEKYEKCLAYLEGTVYGEYVEPQDINLRFGSTGNLVVKMQEKLGINSDGIFGKGTESVLKAWQRANGLFPDGIVGNNTYEKLFK